MNKVTTKLKEFLSWVGRGNACDAETGFCFPESYPNLNVKQDDIKADEEKESKTSYKH